MKSTKNKQTISFHVLAYLMKVWICWILCKVLRNIYILNSSIQGAPKLSAGYEISHLILEKCSFIEFFPIGLSAYRCSALQWYQTSMAAVCTQGTNWISYAVTKNITESMRNCHGLEQNQLLDFLVFKLVLKAIHDFWWIFS